MKIEKQIIRLESKDIPCIKLTPIISKGGALIIHGYGGCKEEQLGLAWRVAENGFTTITIDLSGHGESVVPLNEDVVKDVKLAIQKCKEFGKVVAIGHSLGGRLALLSSADYSIALSPALSQIFTEQTQATIKALRSYRVRETNPNINFEILNKLPQWEPNNDRNVQIIYGSRDVPDIISSCKELKEKGVSVIQINNALHNDIYLLEETFSVIIGQVNQWYK